MKTKPLLFLLLAITLTAWAATTRGRWTQQTFTTSSTNSAGTRVASTQFVHVASTFLLFNTGVDYVGIGPNSNANQWFIAPTNGFTLPVVPGVEYDLYDIYFKSATATQAVRFMYPQSQ